MESSSEESSVTDYSTESSDEDGMETAQINGTKLLLPQGLCDKEDIFKEFFTPHLWNSLSNEHKTHLQTFLPTFTNNDENEKTTTLQRLFNFETFKFTSPLQEFHDHLRAGYFRPDIAKMRRMIRKAERKEARHRYRSHKEKLKHSILESRRKLLNQIRNLPPGCEPKSEKIGFTDLNLIRHRTKRRYFQVLTSIGSKTEHGCSSDENYLETTSISLSRKQKRHLNSIKNSLQSSSEQKFFCSVNGKSSTNDLERFITPNANPFYINDEAYRTLLKIYKKRKQEEPDDLELNTRNITLSDVIHRTQLPYSKVVVQVQPSKNIHNFSNSDNNRQPCRKKIKKAVISNTNNYYHQTSVFHNNVISTNPTSNSEYENNNSDSDSVIDAVTVPTFKTKKTELISRTPNKVTTIPLNHKANVKVEVKKEEPDEVATVVVPISQEVTVNTNATTTMISPISNYSQYGKIMPVTLSDLEGIDMMNLPIDLDNSDIDILEVNNKPELMQETHSNFLSLVRDVICSTNEHRMNFHTLEKRLQTWQESPISPLNDWYSLCENWCGVLQSAINFLCGNSTDLPNDFVPYLEYKQHLDAYQWIGAGRDGDNLLAPLCKFWLDHRDEVKNVKVKEEVDVEISDRSQTPPPPRCPTNWTIRKATMDEVERLREQEKRRYENPHKAFTYKCNGYESVVAPLKGIYNPSTGNTKARGHSILTGDRPNFVTILSLVRDATARLPNGEGTRGDIVELLKQSQYISSNATDNVLQTVVSGALDRMHTQFDPCVKYDTKRKIWIYLHRNRSEEDFEKIHQHLQGVAKTPKKTSRKSPSKPKIKQATSGDKLKQQVKDGETPKKTVQIPLTKATTTTIVSPSSNISKPSNSLLISNNIQQQQQQREPSPPTIQILENIQMPSSVKSQDDHEITEALQAIVDNRISSPKLTKTPKGLVKILSPSQSKSLILATKHEKPKQQILAKQLIHMGTTPNQTILLQKSEGNETNGNKPAQQIIQTVPTQLQNIKTATFLRNSLPNSQNQTISVIQTADTQGAKTADQIPSPGIQIKTPNNLTPAQQQQILQTIKQKILPQTVLASQHQQLLLKHKLAQVQKTNQNTPQTISLLGQTTKINTENSASKSGIVTQTPVVAKVLTNAAGQVISVESLLAHQKQHGTLPPGATLRVATSKGNQANIIHLSGTPKQNLAQFTVQSQNNLIALTSQPKLVMATSTSTVTSTTTLNKNREKSNRTTTQLTKLPTKVTQQLINAKLIQNIDGTQKVVQPKLIVGPSGASVKRSMNSATKNITHIQKPTLSIAANSNSIRMANLNLTHIAGKPVLLASKGGTIQNLQGQNVILQQSASGPSLVLQNNKNVVQTSSNVAPGTNNSTSGSSGANLNIINQGNVVLGSQVKMQQPPQVVFKNNTVNQVTQGHLVLGGQPVRLHTTGTSPSQRLVLASQGQGGQIVTQQILLPAGFQGTAINIKSLQGVKVIPIAQAHAQNRGVQSRQVFARVVNPTITTKTQQIPSLTEKIDEGNSQEGS